jgi:hypothetical protein
MTRTRRTDWLQEQHADTNSSLDDGWLAKEMVAKENERIWAHYRDPDTGLTQVEARDRAQRCDYPTDNNVSQAQVSRIISRLDDEMVTDPVVSLHMKERPESEDEPEHADRGLLGPRWERDRLDEHGGGVVVDAFRARLARFLVDKLAIREFQVGLTKTPAWAQSRFPDLDPDIGREVATRDDLHRGEDLHPPSKQEQTTPADD